MIRALLENSVKPEPRCASGFFVSHASKEVIHAHRSPEGL